MLEMPVADFYYEIFVEMLTLILKNYINFKEKKV